MPEATSHSRHGFLFERRRVAVPGMAYWVGPPARLTSPLLTYIFIYYLTTGWATLLVGHAAAQSTLVGGHKIVIQTEVSKETKKERDRTNLKWKGKKLEIQTKVKNKNTKNTSKRGQGREEEKTETKRLIVSTNYINLHAREARAKQNEGNVRLIENRESESKSEKTVNRRGTHTHQHRQQVSLTFI